MASGFHQLASHIVKVQALSKQGLVFPADLEEMLGPPRYTVSKAEEQNEVGLANGLAYTEAGGDMLQIEVSVVGRPDCPATFESRNGAIFTFRTVTFSMVTPGALPLMLKPKSATPLPSSSSPLK